MTKPSASAHMDKRLPHGLPATIKGGHLGFWERHEEVAQLLTEFMHRVIRTPESLKPGVKSPLANSNGGAGTKAESTARKLQ
jgi:hypothetical protein